MSPATLWFLLAVVAAIVEVISPLFGFIFVSGAALLAAGMALLGPSLLFQVLLFVIVLLVSLFVLRPRLVGRFGSTGVPSRVDVLIGQRGRVIEAIDPASGAGRVQVAGEDWAARSSEAIPAGSEIIIDGADGIVLSVTPAD